MTQTHAKTAKTAKTPEPPTDHAGPSFVDRTAELSDDVLKSVEKGQRAALEAVRKFIDTVDEMLPSLADRPSRRETVIDGALELADKLVTTQYEFLRSVVRSADRSLTGAGSKS